MPFDLYMCKNEQVWENNIAPKEKHKQKQKQR